MVRKIKEYTIYKHFKGKYYYVLDIAKDATNDGKEKQVVVYRALYDNCDLYTRDLDEFSSEVDHEKYPDVKQKYRFQECKFNTILKLFGFKEVYDPRDCSFVYMSLEDTYRLLEVSENNIIEYYVDNFIFTKPKLKHLPITNEIALLSEIIRYNKFGIKPTYSININKEE